MSESKKDDDIIICRCEDLRRSDILKAIREHGLTSFDEVKRVTRCGMGPCQGKTCRRLVERIIAKNAGKSIEDLEPATFRQPTKPIDIKVLARAWGEEEEK